MKITKRKMKLINYMVYQNDWNSLKIYVFEMWITKMFKTMKVLRLHQLNNFVIKLYNITFFICLEDSWILHILFKILFSCWTVITVKHQFDWDYNSVRYDNSIRAKFRIITSILLNKNINNIIIKIMNNDN